MRPQKKDPFNKFFYNEEGELSYGEGDFSVVDSKVIQDYVN